MARKKNPTPLVNTLLVGLGVAGVIGGAVAIDKYVEQKAKKKAKEKKEQAPAVHPLSGVWAENATLGNAPLVVNEVMLPIDLSFEPEVRDLQGNVGPAGGNVVNSQLVLESLVTNLTSDTADVAYNYMLFLAAEKGMDMSNPTVRDEATQRTLSRVAPRVDWTKGLQPYTVGSPEFDVWLGVQMLGEIAYQSYWNKQAATEA
jgi:hypothetical protein